MTTNIRGREKKMDNGMESVIRGFIEMIPNIILLDSLYRAGIWCLKCKVLVVIQALY